MINYLGSTHCVHRHVYTYHESEMPAMTWDNQEEMTGMSNACEIISEHIVPILQGRELSMVKWIDD